MALSSGSKLGPYTIVGALGAGGMGEVYRARDDRLSREVAVKVLPGHLSASTEAKQRFEREARSASSLNHPNICVIHDIGSHEGTDYLVMELLEGETLADRLERGPMPLNELLGVAIPIADALNRAHRSGLIHRDLKPGNIMLTKAGAKLLDFGLAKSLALSPEVTGLTAVPTAASPLTTQGMIVGTFQYMAPEQLQGKEADARSDIFAFGAVLHEMATGKRAFDGKTQAGVMAAILEREPEPLSSVAPAMPPALERLVGTCVAKDPEERRQSMQDVLQDLRWIAEGGGAPAPEASVRRPGRERLAWGVAALLAVIAALSLWTALRAPVPPPPEALQASILPPDGYRYSLQSPFALSPDGRRVAFVAAKEDRVELWVRDLGQSEARAMEGSDGAAYPFWSPDGNSIAFFAGGKLKRVSLLGGPAVNLCDVRTGRGGTWSPNGIIVFQPNFSDPLYRVADTGGAPEPLTRLKPEEKEIAHRWPQFLPDGEHFLYFLVSTTDPARSEKTGVYVASLDDPENPRFVLNVDSRATFSRGHLVYKRETTLMAQPFDPGTLELTGEPAPLLGSVTGGFWSWGGAQFSTSENGALVLHQGSSQGQLAELIWYDRSGGQIGKIDGEDSYDSPRLSPDGTKLLVSTGGTAGDIWLHDLKRDVRTRLTFDRAVDTRPIWAPDGKSFVFESYRNPGGIYRRSTTGTGSAELVMQPEDDAIVFRPIDWAPDGSAILYQDVDMVTAVDLWLFSLADKEKIPLVVGEFDQWDGRFSPDGRWLAYVSDESDRNEIYLRALDNPASKWQVSRGGGTHPAWRGDGKELYYRAPDGMLTAVEIQLEPELSIGTPEPLFQTYTMLDRVQGIYDVTADGQRFLVRTAPGGREGRSMPMTLVLNWPALLLTP